LNKSSAFVRQCATVLKHYYGAVLVGVFLPTMLCAQTELIPLDHQLQNRLGMTIYNRAAGVHSSIQPYELRDLAGGNTIDSILGIGRVVDTSEGSWLHRKIFSEHLLEVSTDDYRLYADFLPDFQIGRDMKDSRNTNLNTRGFAVGGSVSTNFSFTSEFYENQAKFPKYIDAFVRKYDVVPGQGAQKYYDPETFDFAYSSAVISYRPSKYLGVQGGQGKNFIGDGYRSLLLSDAAFNYPYLKLTADIWKMKYMCMWAEFQDIRNTSGSDIFPMDKKSGVFHYLDIHLTDRLSLGLFEGIIWLPEDSSHYRGFEWNYLNPIIFLRPVEYSIGSPDNVLMGLNLRYLVSSKTALYGQVLIDEMTVGEYIKNTGYWANKYGIQAGVKSFEPVNITGLFVQTEVNLASPYTYSHREPLKNYGHYNQSLAHPLGANFYESVTIAEYHAARFDLRGQVTVARYGDDSSAVSYGKDIYKSYDLRAGDYGQYIGQGVKTNLLYADVRVAYVLNPITNLRFELGAAYRRLTSSVDSQESFTVTFGLRSSFRNLYYDF
jgi:hypothetical protein